MFVVYILERAASRLMEIGDHMNEQDWRSASDRFAEVANSALTAAETARATQKSERRTFTEGAINGPLSEALANAAAKLRLRAAARIASGIDDLIVF